jgi:hypothetical protein
MQHTIEIILARATLIVDELRHTQTMHRRVTLRFEWTQQRKGVGKLLAHNDRLSIGAGGLMIRRLFVLVYQVDRELKLSLLL